MTRHSRLLGLMVAGFAWLSVPALAQNNAAPNGAPVPVRHVRGTVQSVQGEMLTVNAPGGEAVKITLTPRTPVLAVVPAAMSTIRRGTFIGTATSGPASNLVAHEVVVFPPAMKGTGEGHYPWDLGGSDSMMTNANVSADVAAKEGRELTLSYKGGESKVFVPPDAPVVALMPGDRSLLAEGAKVFVPAMSRDGMLVARAVLVGKDGLKPPM